MLIAMKTKSGMEVVTIVLQEGTLELLRTMATLHDRSLQDVTQVLVDHACCKMCDAHSDSDSAN